MRTPLLAGNWKMYMTSEEGGKLGRELKRSFAKIVDREIMVAPPFTALQAVSKAIAGSRIKLGAQNMHSDEWGAFTGEISAPMLLALGVSHVIIGHSERRHYFRETNEDCRAKIAKALSCGLIPIYCVGETLMDRERGRTFRVLDKQLEEALDGIDRALAPEIVVAYEPVWAIGTGRTATPETAQQAHERIRSEMARLFSATTAAKTRILYGGSVKPDNIDRLMVETDIDGALVGGASLGAESFERIVKFVPGASK